MPRENKTHRPLASTVAALAAGLAVALSGCSSQSPSEPQESSSAPSEQTAAPVIIPETAVGAVAAELLDVLNRDEDSTPADWDNLTEEFTAQVPVDQMVQLINQQMRPAKPFTAVGYEGSENSAVVRLSNPLTDDLLMNVTLNQSGQIAGLLFTPAPDEDREKLGSLDEVPGALDELPGTIHAYIASLDGSDVVLDRASTESAPLGSMFKLYVLLALANQIEAGEISWDDTLTLKDSDKSLPSGQLQDKPAGTQLSVFDAAMGMISISDNTATDILIDLVGQDALAQAVKQAKHHNPEELSPFLRTKDAFMLSWSDNVHLLDRWADADSAARADLLTQLQAEDFDVAVEDLAPEPTWPQGAEWFASAQDIANVHRALDGLDDPKIAEILTKNPGLKFTGWDHVAFKGGSDVGVLAGSWLVRDDKGEGYVVVLQQSAEDAAGAQQITAGQLDFFNVVNDAVDLLATQ